MKKEMLKEDQTAVFSDEQKSALAGKIAKKFDELNDARQNQINDIKKVRDAIYCRRNTNEDVWHSNIKLPDLYELAQTLKAYVWENLYSNPEAMFDVSGKSPDSQIHAPAQKAMLVNVFDDMKVQYEIEKAVDNIIETGEATLFVGWETKSKQVRRHKTIVENFIDDVSNELLETEVDKFVVEEQVIFDGPRVRSINTENFVFDSTRKNNWDSCAKIYKTWMTPQEIFDNEVYELAQDKKDRLVSLISESKKNKNSDEKIVKDSQIEVLEYWGDIKIDDGTVLKNMLITVAGRDSVIRCESNPYISNPFINLSLIEDPETKRGISPLRVALVLNEISSDILNRQLDALALVMNPPYLAPKGCFSGKQEVSPGKIIEYEASMMPQAPVALNFDTAIKGWDFITFFGQTLESSTGIFNNMSGDLQSSSRTATELNYSVSGQTTRLNMIIDTINRKLVLPMVEKVADLLANFKYGEETILVNQKGIIQYIPIDDGIRTADYVYKYGDRKVTLDRKNRFNELYSIITDFSKVPEVEQQIDWLECFKYALEQYGIENSENFLKQVPAFLPQNNIGVSKNISK